ncbi:hypothetical protein C5D34_16180, partial [Rathayibacter sp. AY1B1]
MHLQRPRRTPQLPTPHAPRAWRDDAPRCTAPSTPRRCLRRPLRRLHGPRGDGAVLDPQGADHRDGRDGVRLPRDRLRPGD